MKKIIIKIVIFVAVLGAIFGVKKYIDFTTYNYKPGVNEALTDYFVNNDQKGLKEITDMLDEYKDNEKKVSEIQDYSYTIVGSWFTYEDQKYACDDTTFRTNMNSCLVQLEEFKNLNDKLAIIGNYKSHEGFTILKKSYYDNLVSQVNKRIADIEKKSKSSRNPLSSEEDRLEKCNKTTECDNCRDGVCKCYYTANGIREELTCNKDIED